jgi:NAD(P)-dependent dehydrogenase (short-subunit alcohol dehydrogenase family)
VVAGSTFAGLAALRSMTGGLALVTGAGRGSGRAVALALAAAGSRLAIIDVNPDAAERTAAEAGATAAAYAVDVSNKLAVQTLLYSLLEAGERLELLVNAAHVAPGSAALKMDEWEWNRTLDVNLKGAFLMSQTVARAMKETGGGLILNVVRRDEAGHAAVRAARAGLLGLTEALQAEWAPFAVRVEAIDAGHDPAQTAAEVVLRREAWRKAT